MDNNYAIKFLTIIVAMFIADVCWAYYFIKIGERKGLQAGLWGSAIYICGAYTVTSYIHDSSLIIAAILGSFLGTWATVEYKKRKEQKRNE